MMKVHVICEGATEQMFVKNFLRPIFTSRQIRLLPDLLGKPGHKGGNVKFERVIRDIRAYLLSDRQARCTTFIDYYGIDSNFPGKQKAKRCATAAQRYEIMCSELDDAVKRELPDHAWRFIPYVQIHEFEGLLFSEPEIMADAINRPDLTATFQSIANKFRTPEDINDREAMSPSHQIIRECPEYHKVLDGPIIAEEIGLRRIREKCPCFASWIDQLEQLSTSPADDEKPS